MTAPLEDKHATEIAAEADALANTAGVRLRDDLRVVYVRGDDRTSWLNGQVTNDVRHIAPQGSVHALAVNVRGKIMAELWVLEQAEQLALLLPTATSETVLQSFERYIIMEDVTLVPDDTARVLSIQGPTAQDVAAKVAPQATTHACDELGHGGVFVLSTQDEVSTLLDAFSAVATRVSDAGFELARLRARVPRFGRDYDDRHYPQEAGLHALLSFNKGCYLGQEVVCTLENRGRMHRNLCALHAKGRRVLTPATTLSTADGSGIGEITGVAFDPAADHTLALGYAKSAHAQSGAQLTAGDAAWTVDGVVGIVGDRS